ncbi:MAG TPA: outer membrane beta-barrel protein [Burkholderiales bacterium]|nr:outer membrane beta-barrel protein [Burkholderiales bacterium]
MKRILSAVALSAAFAAAPALAQQSQVYVGAGPGIANTDSSEFSWKILGGYQHDRHWGIEAAYTDLGSYRGSSADSLSLAFTGTLPLDRRWALMAKAGVASNHTRVAGSSDQGGALVGIGVAYTVSRRFGLRLEYEQYGRVAGPGSGFNDRADNLALIGKVSF